MNGGYGGNRNTDSEIDTVDFEHKVDNDIIRRNEQLDRQMRQKRAAQLRRRERLRRERIKRLKTAAIAWATLLGAIAVLIAIVFGVVSAIKKASEPKEKNENLISPELTAIADGFLQSDSIVYSSGDNAMYAAADEFVKDFALGAMGKTDIPDVGADASSLLWQVKRYVWSSDRTKLNQVKQIIRDYPIFSNGYVWSSSNSMKSENSGFYLYDTNARFISAVCEICLWEADTSFLYETDLTGEPRSDVSKDKTVLDKLEMAADYYFDKNDANGGGIRFNEADSLVYVLTESNNASSNGAGSNYWFNHRFGYLDTYNNIAFYQAMNDLSRLYTLMGQTDNAQKYADFAQKNRESVNNLLWNGSYERYVGARDGSGAEHDLGFTFLNLEAVSSGMASGERADSILSWLDGERTINSDTSAGEDIYAFGFAPRSTTAAASDSWWDYVNGTYPLSSSAAFGKYWQNGGAALITEYYDLLARAKVKPETLGARIKALTDSYSDGALSEKSDEASAINGKAECGSAASAVVYALFGLDSDGSSLTVNPAASYDGEYVGIKGVGFGNGSYDFLFGTDEVFVMSEQAEAVRLKIGGLAPNAEYEVKLCENGEFQRTEPAQTDENGFLSLSERFGAESYLYIARKPDETEE